MNDQRFCANCRFFNGQYCTKYWNNGDEDYCVPELDYREDKDTCREWEAE